MHYFVELLGVVNSSELPHIEIKVAELFAWLMGE